MLRLCGSEQVFDLSMLSALVGEAFDELGLDQALWPFVIMKVEGVLGGVTRRESDSKTYLFWSPLALADIFSVIEPGENLFDSCFLFSCLLLFKALPSLPCLLLLVLEGLLDELDIFKTQLLADDIEIPCGVDVTLNVDDLSIIKAPDHLEDGIYGTDVRQEGIAETGAG